MSEGDSRPVVLVTGAGSGLGFALVGAFAAAGWAVEAVGHSALPAFSENDIHCSRMDVTSDASVKEVVGEILRRRGRLQALVNNAGIRRDAPMARTSDADWDMVLGVNLKGPFLCSKAVLPTMVHRREGQILNIASFAARGGNRGQCGYAASKAGLIGLTLALAKEVGGAGIRVNAVLPGVLPTGMIDGLPEEALRSFTEANALGRLNGLCETAQAIVRIAAMRDVSGQVFALDSRVSRWA